MLKRPFVGLWTLQLHVGVLVDHGPVHVVLVYCAVLFCYAASLMRHNLCHLIGSLTVTHCDAVCSQTTPTNQPEMNFSRWKMPLPKQEIHSASSNRLKFSSSNWSQKFVLRKICESETDFGEISISNLFTASIIIMIFDTNKHDKSRC